MTSHVLDPLLRHLEVPKPLPDEDRAAVLALPVSVKSFEAGAYLVREGEPPHRCGILISGFAVRQKHSGDGLRQILSLHIPGEAFDLQSLFLECADHSVQMLNRGDVALIPCEDLRDLVLSRPAVAVAVTTALLVEASIFREWILNVGRRDARTRTAHLLCEFAVRMSAKGLSEGAAWELPITQEQLADALGLTPVHVNRTLKALEAEGLITRNRRSVSFPSWKRLRDVADFNQRYLHLSEDVEHCL